MTLEGRYYAGCYFNDDLPCVNCGSCEKRPHEELSYVCPVCKNELNKEDLFYTDPSGEAVGCVCCVDLKKIQKHECSCCHETANCTVVNDEYFCNDCLTVYTAGDDEVKDEVLKIEYDY